MIKEWLCEKIESGEPPWVSIQEERWKALIPIMIVVGGLFVALIIVGIMACLGY